MTPREISRDFYAAWATRLITGLAMLLIALFSWTAVRLLDGIDSNVKQLWDSASSEKQAAAETKSTIAVILTKLDDDSRRLDAIEKKLP